MIDDLLCTPSTIADEVVKATVTTQTSTITHYSHITMIYTDKPLPRFSSTIAIFGTEGSNKSSTTPLVGLSVGVSVFILTLAMLIIVFIAVLWIHIRRKAARQKRQSSEYQDDPYSTLHLGESNRSELQANANLYEQFHLSPSTEFIPSAESEAVNNISWQPLADFQSIYSRVDTEQPNTGPQETEEINLDDPTYAIIDKRNNKEESKISHGGQPVYSNNQDLIVTNDKESCTVENEPKLREEALEAMYAVVNKKRKINQEDTPPLPPHTVDELHTAVDKNSKINTTGDEEKAPPIPPHTIEGLCTAVKKDPNGKAENEEVAPPLPPHTVEELYMAVVKRPKGNVEKDEEEAPPIPPQIIDQL